ncbi:hypothetical protein, partial [Staphylococcus aureus]
YEVFAALLVGVSSTLSIEYMLSSVLVVNMNRIDLHTIEAHLIYADTPANDCGIMLAYPLNLPLNC